MKNFSGSVLIFYQIPKHLNAQLPPAMQINKTDNNMGVDSNWTKIVVHIMQGNQRFNLPRVFWARKNWHL